MKTWTFSHLSSMTCTGLVACLASAPLAAEVVGFRMDGDGRYPDAKPPINWSPTDNVAWKLPLSSWSNASPVLLEATGVVVVMNEPDEIVAVDMVTGKVAWRDSMGDVQVGENKAHDDNGWTSPTPVSDGTHVFSVLGSGVVAAHTVDGERKWARVVQTPEHRWGSSASPVLAGGRLIVQRSQLVALDPKTGDEVWAAESDPKWGSPIGATIGGVDVVITPAGDVFSAADGEWIAAGLGNLDYATPVIDDGVVYFIEKRALAVRLPKTVEGSFDQVWKSRVKGSRHYASSLIHDGLLYAVSREQDYTVLDAATGEVLLERKLDLDANSGSNSAYPSITMAGGKIFVGAVNGTTVVLEPGSEYKELARNATEGYRSSPVFAGNRMYLRAFDHLYSFGADPSGSTSATSASR
ncbi:MAG: PQQ-binding-like beta-propeller repeat protein [Acidobacteriota bacterium]